MSPAERHDHLTRRQMLVASGAVGLGAGALLLGCGDGDGAAHSGTAPAAPAAPATTAGATPASCVLAPEQTEGPYYIAGEALRRNITEGRPGTPLRLELAVQRVPACAPVKGATVELWHADAGGEYSGFGGSAGNRTFLRGGQRTGADGVATIDTVFPGWYEGRTTHIHVKLHAGGDNVHTGQLYFDDDITRRIQGRAPYDTRGPAQVTNADDPIFASGGHESTVSLKRSGRGYSGRLTLGVQA